MGGDRDISDNYKAMWKLCGIPTVVKKVAWPCLSPKGWLGCNEMKMVQKTFQEEGSAGAIQGNK